MGADDRGALVATALRLILCVDLVGWCLVLGAPGATFAISHVYDLMAHWMTEDHWSIAFGVTAAACLLGAPRRVWRIVRVLPLVVACLMQAAVAVSFGGGPTIGTGFSSHLMGALLACLLVWQELKDAL